jgi:carbon-monoxide dehydrogenase small subunit
MPQSLLSLTVNGQLVQRHVASETLLVDFLRDTLELRGTHVGCDTAQCGACTVLVDRRAQKSCNRLAVQCAARAVTTIEGIAAPGAPLHVMLQAFARHHALQCGYCTPGFVLRALAMVEEGVPAESRAVREALSGNLCRCTGYEGIVTAICEGLRQLRGERAPTALEPATSPMGEPAT